MNPVRQFAFCSWLDRKTLSSVWLVDSTAARESKRQAQRRQEWSRIMTKMQQIPRSCSRFGWPDVAPGNANDTAHGQGGEVQHRIQHHRLESCSASVVSQKFVTFQHNRARREPHIKNHSCVAPLGKGQLLRAVFALIARIMSPNLRTPDY